MYRNIAEKIQIVAMIYFVLVALSGVVGGIVLLAYNIIALGLILLSVVPIVALVTSWMIYGFGVLIDSNIRISKRLLACKTTLDTIATNLSADKNIQSKPLIDPETLKAAELLLASNRISQEEYDAIVNLED